MKFRRFLSGLLFGVGCALIFVGILATALPSIPNPQLQLVLASFSMPSDHSVVALMNRAMSFALAQNWRVLLLGILITAAGAWLLLYFTPKQRKPVQAVSLPPQPMPAASAPEVEPTPAPDDPNPFAVGTYLDHLPLRKPKTASSFVTHAAPLLEPNHIDDPPAPAEPAPMYFFTADEEAPDSSAPYFSSRFETESRAIETERGTPSQSGSSILIRSAFEAALPVEAPVQKPVEPDSLAEEIPVRPAAPLSTPAPMAPFSPRIRSTMGRKSSRQSS